MEKWKTCLLKEFGVDGISLMLELYPNGEDEEDIKHVSLLIVNRSGVDIDILFDLNMGKKVNFTDENFSIKAGHFCGYGHFYDHDNENRWNAEDEEYGSDDSDFEITFTVKKLWKQFHVDGVKSIMSQNFRSVEKELGSLGDSVKCLLSRKEEDSKTNIPYPECPICLEDMTLETKIMQCYLGHPMCGICQGVRTSSRPRFAPPARQE